MKKHILGLDIGVASIGFAHLLERESGISRNLRCEDPINRTKRK